jgi:hypothetical protein
LVRTNGGASATTALNLEFSLASETLNKSCSLRWISTQLQAYCFQKRITIAQARGNLLLYQLMQAHFLGLGPLGNSEEELAPQSLGLASTGMNQDRGLRADHLIRTEDTLAGLPVDKVELALIGVNPVVEREPALIEVNDGP